VSEFRIDLNAFGRIRRELGEPLVEAAAVIVRDEIVAQMQPGTPRTGHTYLVPSTKAEYVASAPGEAPAERETDYVSSWKSSPAVTEGNRVAAMAYSDLQEKDGTYRGLNLEHGTTRYTEPGPDSMIVPSVVHILPRPHIGPGVAAARERIAKLVQEASSR
jgi:hypothetical protein